MKSKILFGLLLLGTTLCASEKRDYEIWRHEGNETVLMPHIAPILWVKQISGPKMPEHGSIACEFKPETKTTPKGDTVQVLNGHCEGGVVVALMAIDLNH